jgi:sugar phosphate isomerase/epimerase
MLIIAGGGLAMASASVAKAITAAVPAQQDVRLGVCTYSVRNFQRQMAISTLKALGVSLVSVKEFHLPYSSTPEEAAKAKSDFAKAGMTIASGGVITLDDKDPKGLRSYFEYARRCGMPMIITAPTHPALSEVEKLAREFDIKVAIHNHGPEDKHFPTPQSVLEAVKGMDPRCGLCIDVGHSLRAGADVVQSIAEAGPRLLDMHMKDLRSATEKESQCDVGQGVMPVVAIFKELKKMKYSGTVNLEYEINAENPLPGMASSLAYMRGVLAGLAG